MEDINTEIKQAKLYLDAMVKGKTAFKDDCDNIKMHLDNIKKLNMHVVLKPLPDGLEPVLAKIEHINSLGKSNWYEVVYFDNENWHSYSGSKTFEDGEKVVKWDYCKAMF